MASGSSSGASKPKNKQSVRVPFLDSKTGILYESFSMYENEKRVLEKLKLENEKVQKEKKQLSKKEKAKKKGALKIGGSQSQTSSPPPKHATQKEEYVKPSGTGHEATGAGDSGGGGKKDKDDHDGGDGRKGGGGEKKKKKDNIYCDKCKRSFNPKYFKNHVCNKVHSTSTIDG